MWKVDHIGVACRDLAQAIEDYEKLGFIKSHSEIHRGTDQPVFVQFMHLGETEIELLEPINKDDPHNPLSSYLQTPLYKMYHMCYEVDDLEDAVKKLKEQGFRVVGKSWLDKTHHDRRMLFLFHRRMGLVEIGEKTV